MAIVTKTASAPGAFVTSVTRALAIVAPDQPVSAMATMEEVIGRSVSSRRFPMLLLSGFALLSLLLAAVGIAGVVGYSVVQRTPEIGVRVALGAQPGDVLRLVIGQSLIWMLAGVAIGLAGCLALLRFLQTLLFGVTATDPVVLGIVSALLLAVALTASYVPARRALRVDPVTALRRV
jgi:putative ABC transport system permease protein